MFLIIFFGLITNLRSHDGVQSEREISESFTSPRAIQKYRQQYDLCQSAVLEKLDDRESDEQELLPEYSTYSAKVGPMN